MKRVLCIGGITADILVHPVDQLPPTGTLVAVEGISTFVGGCAANTAMDLGRLGVPVSLCCKIGEDAFGSFVTEEMKKNHVNVSGVAVDAKVPTSTTMVVINSSGERSFLYCPGSTSELSAEDVPDALVEAHDIIFISSAMLLTKFDGEPAAAVLRRAQNLGKYTAMDTVWDPDGVWLDKIAPAIPYLDLFMPSIEEAEQLAGTSDHDAIADFFHEMGAKNVIIKDGKRGAYICEEGSSRYWSPAFLQPNPVDTTGAGDSFCAGMLCGLANGWSYQKSVRFANAVGCHCVMAKGAYAGIPSMREVEAFLAKQN